MISPYITPVLEHKVGAPFLYGGPFKYVDAAGMPLSTEGITGRGQIRTPAPEGKLIANLDVSIVAGFVTVQQPPGNSSANWPIGRAELDLVLTLPGGNQVATDTVQLRLLPAVTQE